MNFEDLKDEGRLLAINKIIIESGDYESNMDSLNQNRYFIPIKDFYRLVDKFALLVNDDWNDPNLEYTEVPAPGNMNSATKALTEINEANREPTIAERTHDALLGGDEDGQ